MITLFFFFSPREIENYLNQSKDKNLHLLLSRKKQGKTEYLCSHKHIVQIFKTLWKASVSKKDNIYIYAENDIYFCRECDVIIALELWYEKV